LEQSFTIVGLAEIAKNVVQFLCRNGEFWLKPPAVPWLPPHKWDGNDESTNYEAAIDLNNFSSFKL
jgi:hypothetical protein